MCVRICTHGCTTTAYIEKQVNRNYRGAESESHGNNVRSIKYRFLIRTRDLLLRKHHPPNFYFPNSARLVSFPIDDYDQALSLSLFLSAVCSTTPALGHDAVTYARGAPRYRGRRRTPRRRHKLHFKAVRRRKEEQGRKRERERGHW